jgi:hypothetical protein
MSVSIATSRTVPVTEDLTTNDLTFNILRGTEIVNRVDVPLSPGVSLVKGEWAVINSSGLAVRAGATGLAQTYPVFAGVERYDVAATGDVTVLMGPYGLIFQTNMYNANLTTVGQEVAINNGGVGASVPILAVTGDYVVAMVVAVGSNYINIQSLSPYLHP